MFSSFTLFALLTVKSSIQVNRKTNVLTLNSKWKKTVIGKCQKSIKRTLPSQKVSAHQRSKECPSQSPIVSVFTFFSTREARLPAELFIFFPRVQPSDLF